MLITGAGSDVLTWSTRSEKEERLKQLEPKVQGPLYQVVMNMFKTVTEKKVTIPSKNFISASGGAGSGIKSSLRASEGYLFLLDRSLFFVHKPATHIRYFYSLVTLSICIRYLN